MGPWEAWMGLWEAWLLVRDLGGLDGVLRGRGWMNKWMNEQANILLLNQWPKGIKMVSSSLALVSYFCHDINSVEAGKWPR